MSAAGSKSRGKAGPGHDTGNDTSVGEWQLALLPSCQAQQPGAFARLNLINFAWPLPTACQVHFARQRHVLQRGSLALATNGDDGSAVHFRQHFVKSLCIM